MQALMYVVQVWLQNFFGVLGTKSYQIDVLAIPC